MKSGMVNWSLYIVLAVYFVLYTVWLLLLIIGNKKNNVIMTEKYLPRSRYPLRELIGVGLCLLNMVHYSFENTKDLKKMAKMKGTYGDRWGVFYYKINMAERMGYMLTLILLGLIVAPISGEMTLLVVSPGLGVLGYILAAGRVSDVINIREDAMMREFPNVVSNLALLINSGMDTFSAWENIAQNGEGIIYEEMRKTIADMKTQGTSEMQAYINFGTRCAIPRITKFISMMVQNIKKGSDDLISFLMYESSSCWSEKKNRAKIQGEKAGSKLMIPIFMIMVGILILIMGPMAANLGF